MNGLLAFNGGLSATVVERLGWVLVHSLWQFSLVALLAGMTARTMRRRTAAARYGVLVGALTISSIVPLVTWLVLPVSAGSGVPISDLASHRSTIDPTDELPNAKLKDPPPSSARIAPSQDALPSDANNPNLRPPTQPVGKWRAVAVPVIVPTWWQRAELALRPWLAWIVVGWVAGVVLCSLRPAFGWYMLRRMQRVGVSPASEDVVAVLRRIASQLGLRRSVRVLQSMLAQVPIVVGYLRPVILLPVSLLCNIPTSQLEAILAHELTHVRRHDFLVNLMQTLVETLFFYHPAVWWMSHRIRIEREHCCDDLVVKLLNNRVEYGRALLAVEELRGQASVLALGASDGSLLSRIRRIVGFNSDRPVNSPWSAISLLACCIATTLSVSLFGWQGQEESGQAELKPRPDQYVAKLSDALQVEFVGLAEMGAEAQSWWHADGSKLGAAPQSKFDGNVQQSGRQMRRALIRVHGAKNHLDVTANITGTRLDEAHGSGGPYVAYAGGVPVEPDQSTTTIEVGVATEELSPVRRLNPTGERMPAPAGSPFDHVSADIKVVRVGHPRLHEVGDRKVNGVPIPLSPIQEAENDERRKQTELTFIPPQPARRLDLSLTLIDKQGQSHHSRSRTYLIDRPEVSYQFLVPTNEVDHFEYQMRLYQYWVTYENVSLQRGKITPLTVKVEPLPAKFTKVPPATTPPPATPQPVNPPAVAQSPVAADAWPSFRHDLAQTGVATTALPEKLELLWDANLGSQIIGTAAIARDRVLVPTMGGDLVCFDQRSGRHVWSYRSLTGKDADMYAPGFKASPTITADAIYIGDESGVFHAIGLDGTLRWTFKTEGEIASSAAVIDGKVLFGSYDRHLYCLDAKTGKPIWKYETQNYVHAAPSVVGGQVIVAGCDQHVRIIDLGTGNQLRDIRVDEFLVGSPAVVGDRIYVSTHGGKVLALNRQTGETVWQYAITKGEMSFMSSPAVVGQLVILGGRDKQVHALNRETGALVWQFQTQEVADSSPVVVGQRVFAGSADGHLYQLDLATGREQWKFDVGAPLTASPAIGRGILVIGSEEDRGRVVCFGAPLTADSAKVQSVYPPLEFRIAAELPDSKLEPRVPADHVQRQFPDNSVIGRMVAKDRGFVWVKVADPRDGGVSLPVEGVRGAELRIALLADTAPHVMAWDRKWTVKECRATVDPQSGNRYSITLKLDEAGGSAMGALTKSHLNQPLAIVVNGEIVAAPKIRSEVRSDILITGNFTKEEAERLASAILPRPLPAEVPKDADTAIDANGEIHGQLVDVATGKPVPGAVVACGAVINDSRLGGGANTITDADGRYRLKCPSPGIYNVWLKKFDGDAGLTAAADDGIQVEAGKASASQLWLVRGRTVTGKVVDVDGKPFADLAVMCSSPARPESASGVHSTKTKPDGTFEFSLIPGRVYMYASEKVAQTGDNPFGVGRSVHVSIEIPASGDIAPLNLALESRESRFGSDEWLRRSTPGTRILRHVNGADVSGTVVDVAGQPIPGAKVFKVDGQIMVANEKGEFRVAVDKGTQFIMYAFHPGYHVWFGTPTSGDELKIVLEQKMAGPGAKRAAADPASSTKKPAPDAELQKRIADYEQVFKDQTDVGSRKAFKLCDTRIVDLETGKPVAGTTINLRFIQPKTDDAPEEIIKDMFWGPKSPSQIELLIPWDVMGLANRDSLLVEFGVSQHPAYRHFTLDRVTIKQLLGDEGADVRERLQLVKLRPMSREEKPKEKPAADKPTPEQPASVVAPNPPQSAGDGSQETQVKLPTGMLQRMGTPQVAANGESDPIYNVRFADDKTLVTTKAGGASVWNVRPTKLQHVLSHQDRTTVRGLATSPDGRLIVTSAFDDTVSVWETATGKRLFTLKGHGRLGGIRISRFNPDGSQFLSWGDDAVLRCWNVKDGTLAAALTIELPGYIAEESKRPPFGYRMTQTFTPDAKSLFVAFEGQLFEFDTATGKALRSAPIQEYTEPMAVSADGKWIATGESQYDGKGEFASAAIVLRDRATLNVVRQWPVSDPLDPAVTNPDLKPATAFLAGNDASMAFSPDSKLLAWSRLGARPGIDIVEVHLDRMNASIPVASPCWCLDFSPDGKTIASGHADSTAGVWNRFQPAFVSRPVARGGRWTPANRTIRVRVVDATDSKPLPGVVIEAERWDGARQYEVDATHTTDAQGVAVFEGLDAIHHMWLVYAKQPMPYIGTYATSSPEQSEVVLKLARSCELTLRAVDSETGKGIPDVLFGRENAAGEAWLQDIVDDTLTLYDEALSPTRRTDTLAGMRRARELEARHAKLPKKSVRTDADGYYRCLVSSYPWSYSVAGFPKGYDRVVPINGTQEIEIQTPSGGKVEYTFKLVKKAVADAAGVGDAVSKMREFPPDFSPDAPNPKLGTLTGRFIYDGEPPEPQETYPDLAALEANSKPKRDSEGRVLGYHMGYLSYLQQQIRPDTKDASLLVGKDRGVANILIWVQSEKIPWNAPPGEPEPATIQARNGNLSPRVSLVKTGQPLLLKSLDPVSVNLRMTPIKSRNEAFHILLGPDRGTTKSQREVTYHEPERVPLRINSDLAPWATAHVLIRSNPYAAISQPDGSFSIPNLPPGDWEFATWHERKGWLQHWPQGKFMKTIKPGENNLGEIKLKPELFQPQD